MAKQVYGIAFDKATGKSATPEQMQQAGWKHIETIDAEFGAYQAEITNAEWKQAQQVGWVEIAKGNTTMEIEA